MPKPRSSSRSRTVALTKLKWLGVQVFAGEVVRGQLRIDPKRFPIIGGAQIDELQRFEVKGSDALYIQPPSPLARTGAIEFLDVKSHDELCALLAERWQTVVEETMRALAEARKLAADAKVCFDPWRIEGSLIHNFERLRLLFSPRGDRACITGIDQREVLADANAPRIILPVERGPDPEASERLWKSAIDQARANLAKSAPTHDEKSMSLDLASRDLERSYESADVIG